MITAKRIGATAQSFDYLLGSIQNDAPGFNDVNMENKIAYYMEGGTPPGLWLGEGAKRLGLGAREVDGRDLEALFSRGVDPVTGNNLGRKYQIQKTTDARITERVDRLPGGLDEETRQAEIDKIVSEEMQRKTSEAVAGFELVFSPQKSISVWWALADPRLKSQIYNVYRSALDDTIRKLEQDVIKTRTGVGGNIQDDILGITAAAFDHWDSRDHDPQLHTHLLISNKVQGSDGNWRTIDSRGSLLPRISEVGAYFDSVLMDKLTERFGLSCTTEQIAADPARYAKYLTDNQLADTMINRTAYSAELVGSHAGIKWQIEDVPMELVHEFSNRSKAVNKRTDELIERYRETYGKHPSQAQLIAIRQQATLHTRQAKTVMSLQALTARWREAARQIVGNAESWANRLMVRNQPQRRFWRLTSYRGDDITGEVINDTADRVLDTLARQRSTWRESNAAAEAYRVTMGWRFRSVEDREVVVNRIVSKVKQGAVLLTPAKAVKVQRFTNDSERMLFQAKNSELYTTKQVWDAEQALLTAGEDAGGIKFDEREVELLLKQVSQDDKVKLGEDQREAVVKILTSGRKVDLLVGAAGAGKTTSLEKLKQVWEKRHGQGTVKGLAPTAKAAAVLAESLHIDTENTAKWLYGLATGDDPNTYRLTAGELLIVDEASLAGSTALHRLQQQCEQAGAKLLLVGDWAQLGAVDAGGAFGLLAKNRSDVPELKQLWRFSQNWEADASKLLRLGKAQALDIYEANGRIKHGVREEVYRELIAAWKKDETANRRALLIAETNEDVVTLNEIAQSWRIKQGLVDDSEQITGSGGLIHPGDRVVTRKNDRANLTASGRFVKNNDEWTVLSVSEHGVVVEADGDTAILSLAYCHDYLQLAYATTAYRSQGRTVDTSHTLVTEQTNRQGLYVAMTRGKHNNTCYVLTDKGDLLGTGQRELNKTNWREILEGALVNNDGDLSAHETAEQLYMSEHSIKTLWNEHQSLTAQLLEEYWDLELIKAGLLTEQIRTHHLKGVLYTNLARVKTAGSDPLKVLQTLPDTKDAEWVSKALKQVKQLSKANSQDKIAWLLETIEVNHSDTTRLNDLDRYRQVIQTIAEQEFEKAVAENESWVKTLPQDMDPVAAHRLGVAVQCYRSLHNIESNDPLGKPPRSSDITQLARYRLLRSQLEKARSAQATPAVNRSVPQQQSHTPERVTQPNL